ncbi:BldC family transcriptional regulator [Jatrophihabitans sp.]|uniref:BldC family transcriptional regulator n=1 Tax=Jatrophihabitans sp. TaxID=1932789 RepID=UPI002B686748|nr:BldC family transcriptional regulator [Jatrophihabitans sp.]
MAAQKAPTEHLLTPADVAALVFVDPKTVSRWASKGKIAFMRTPGGHRRFRFSDVQALMFEVLSQDPLQAEAMSALVIGGTNHLMLEGRSGANSTEEPWVAPATRGSGYLAADATADAVVAEAVALVLETQAQAAAEVVLETAVSVVVAAEKAASAAVKARRARTFAVAAAAKVNAGDTGLAAAAMRSLVTAQAARLAEGAAQANRLVGFSGTEAQNPLVAERMAATVQAAADTAMADGSLVAAHVDHTFTDAMAHAAAMVAAFDLPLERRAATSGDIAPLQGSSDPRVPGNAAPVPRGADQMS